MIANIRQYAIAERKLKDCIVLRKRLLNRLNMAPNPGQTQQKVDDLQLRAELITNEMKEYIALSTGRVAPPDLSGINDLPNNLIRVRVALGWSQLEFARKFGVTASHVHRWESSRYKSVSLSKVVAVANFLNHALKQQEQSRKMLGRPLKLGADWFNDDFRPLSKDLELSRGSEVPRD